jgi:dTDP-4-dehydrorhamnose reductase
MVKPPRPLAQAADRCGATLVHISTDYVFDGQQNQPYQPESPTHPLGVYGQSKLAGELAVLEACDRHVILRTAWVYGAKGQGNFVKTMLRLGAERDTLKVVYDQVGCPTWSYDIAQAIAQLIPHLAPKILLASTISPTAARSAGTTLPIAIFEEAAALGYPLTLKTDMVPITTDQYPTAAQRPAYSVLGSAIDAQVIHQTPPIGASVSAKCCGNS